MGRVERSLRRLEKTVVRRAEWRSDRVGRQIEYFDLRIV